ETRSLRTKPPLDSTLSISSRTALPSFSRDSIALRISFISKVLQMLLQPSRNSLQLAFASQAAHSSGMRALLLPMLIATCRAGGPFGAPANRRRELGAKRPDPRHLIEQHSDGRRSERRLVLKKLEEREQRRETNDPKYRNFSRHHTAVRGV